MRRVILRDPRRRLRNRLARWPRLVPAPSRRPGVRRQIRQRRRPLTQQRQLAEEDLAGVAVLQGHLQWCGGPRDWNGEAVEPGLRVGGGGAVGREDGICGEGHVGGEGWWWGRSSGRCGGCILVE